MSELPWVFWVWVALHLIWTVVNWTLYLDAKRMRREAEDMLRERRMVQQWHEVKWGER